MPTNYDHEEFSLLANCVEIAFSIVTSEQYLAPMSHWHSLNGNKEVCDVLFAETS